MCIFLILIFTNLHPPSVDSLVVQSYHGFTPGYGTTPSYDGDDTIYLLGFKPKNKRTRHEIWNYVISEQKFKTTLDLPDSVQQIKSSFAGDAGDIYFLTNTSLYHFNARTRRVVTLTEALDGCDIKLGYTLTNLRERMFFICSLPAGKSAQVVGFDLKTNTTLTVGSVQLVYDSTTVLTTVDQTMLVLSGRNYINYKVGRDNLKLEALQVEIPVSALISNAIQIGQLTLVFSNDFDMITVHLAAQKVFVDELDFGYVEKVFDKFASVYVEKSEKIYIFASGGRINGCAVLSIDVCSTPRIVQSSPTHLSALDRSNVTLTCDVASDPKPFVHWLHNGKFKRRGTDLVLPKIHFGYAGNYTCYAESICGVQTREVQLLVRRRTTIEKWKSVIFAHPGKTAELNCKPTRDNWPGDIRWFKDSTELVFSSNISSTTMTNGETIVFRHKPGSGGLEIFAVTVAQSGYYTCLVDTTMDSVNATVNLIVRTDLEQILVDNEFNRSASKTPTFQETPSLSFHIMPAVIVGIVTAVVVLGLCLMLTTYWFIKYKNATVTALTPEEIREFREGRRTIVARGHDAQNVEEFTNGQPYNTAYELALSAFEIDRDTILGQGEFGIVYKGVVRKGATVETVAFKTTRTRTQDQECSKDLKKFLAELKLMIYIGHHPNIIHLVGAFTRQLAEGVVYVALEFCVNGSLEKLLQKCKHAVSLKEGEQKGHKTYDNCISVTTSLQSEWSLQIAKGMDYLSNKKIIHSDLATRNILVAADLSIRITDFGLSRRLENYANYVKMGGEPLPWRWMAVESLECRNFSSESDVWSYGVTLWEIYSMGNIPYPGETWTIDFVRKLKSGEVLPQPEYASEEIYNKMKTCWNPDPTQRPGFKDLMQFFYEISYLHRNIVYIH